MRHSIVAACLVLGAGFAGQCVAQGEYPSRPVRFVVPFAPGGATDIITRLLAEQMQQVLGRPVPVENRGGAGGNVGAAEVAGSPADGYTMLMGSPGPNAINQFLYAKMPFQSDTAFSPVMLVAILPNVLVVHPSLGVKSVQELLERVRSGAVTVNFGTAGAGSSGHLSVELFRSMTRTTMTHIPYKGTGPALQDLLAGHVQLMIDNIPPMIPHIKAGKLVALGVTTTRRATSLPDVSPISTAVPGYEAGSWVGIVVPAGTPAAVVARLNDAANKGVARPEVRERMTALGAEPSGGTAQEFGEFIARETVKWKAVVQVSGAKVD